MKIISLEGLDKSGKHSVSLAVADQLGKDGFKVVQSEFHRYDTPTGQLIKKFLYGEYDVSQNTIELIMAADKFAQQEWFDQLEEEGTDYLVLDRYIHSQYAYSNATTSNHQFTKLIEKINSHLRQPDYTIYLDVSVENSMSRKGQHGDNDRYESDMDLLERVTHYYFMHEDAFNPKFKVINANECLENTIDEALSAINEIVIDDE